MTELIPEAFPWQKQCVGAIISATYNLVFAAFSSFGLLRPFARRILGLVSLDSKCIFGNFICANVF